MKLIWCSGRKQRHCRWWARQIQKKQKFQLTFVGIDPKHCSRLNTITTIASWMSKISLQCQSIKLIYFWHWCEDANLSAGSFYKVTENPALPCWTCNSGAKVDDTMHTSHNYLTIVYFSLNRNVYQQRWMFLSFPRALPVWNNQSSSSIHLVVLPLN